jgi:phage-Barnase-EndoU-ColicinE5/D-RelE like nuclease3
MKWLDLETLKVKKCIKVGILNQNVIRLLNLKINPCDIVIWDARLAHIELHKKDFKNEESFVKHIELIPEIIENPDYIGLHPTKNSIEFIKILDELMIVAVRIKNKGNLAVRTVFILSETQLIDYMKGGTVVKYQSDVD